MSAHRKSVEKMLSEALLETGVLVAVFGMLEPHHLPSVAIASVTAFSLGLVLERSRVR